LDPAFITDTDGLHWAVDRLARLHDVTGRQPHPGDTPALGLPDKLPAKGLGDRRALELLADGPLAGVARLGHPGFFAHMDPPTPWVTWAAALWASAFNQNLLHIDTGPAARELERLVIEWLAPAFGMSGGHLVPGSTVANLTALWAAREVAGVEAVVASAASHVSIRKAAHLLGLDLQVLPVDDSGKVDFGAAPDLTGAALVLAAGTVASGQVEPLRRVPQAA
jgi:L-2,4-diaminobutyrate decarboxylase